MSAAILTAATTTVDRMPVCKKQKAAEDGGLFYSALRERG